MNSSNSKIDEILDKYWVEFLVWYADFDEKTELTANSFDGKRVRPVIDIFWYWLVTVKDKDSSSHTFLKGLTHEQQ